MHKITLPESLHFAVEHLAARGGFESAADYIAELVRRDVEQNPPEPSAPLRQLVEEANGRILTEPEWERCTRKLESLLIEGLDSGPAVEMTAEDWADIRRRVGDRLDRKEP
jgi:antitoxin ParD1/3/4